MNASFFTGTSPQPMNTDCSIAFHDLPVEAHINPAAYSPEEMRRFCRQSWEYLIRKAEFLSAVRTREKRAYPFGESTAH
ncbi:uncharacterized protein Dmul_06320 [Desulfococcus multivorans]|jgi:hypothetical protein|nr:uncharacterized protein Dmul_06320 [Desulfococcus multivorans]